jgi:disulfide bond formation protein DsbB
MSKQKNNIFLIFVLLVVLVGFISTLIIQYGLGHQPCKLCIYERVPYILSIFLIITVLLLKKYEKIILLLLTILFFFSFSLAFYHFGIEQGFFNELVACKTESFTEDLSKEQVLEQLKQGAISCKDVSFKFLGFSLATINSIFSLILSVIFAKLFISYGKN